MPSSPPAKPLIPILQSAHSFASGLQAAWLFVESSGVSIFDYSGNSRHLSCSNVSDGSWIGGGSSAVRLRYSAPGEAHSIATPGSIAGLNFALATDTWTETYIIRVDDVSGTKPRLRSRAGNVIDLAVLPAASNRRLEYFSGAAWVDFQSTAASGVYHIFTFVHGADTVLTLYKDGVQQITGLGGIGVGNTGQIWLWTPPADNTSEWTEGEMMAGFIHNRALSASEVAANASSPYAAFTTATASPSTDGLGFNFDLI